MNEQTAKLIADLASKLGTTAEHLWSVLARQAPISCGIVLVSLAAEITFLIWFTRWLWRNPVVKSEDEDRHVFSVAARVFVWIGVAILWCVASCAVEDSGTYISGFTNPEYWALKQIIK